MPSQFGLFEPPPPAPDAPQVLLDDQSRGCWVRYWPRFLATTAADELFQHLTTSAPFTPEVVVIAGKAIEVRRRSCAFGEPGARYHYTGVTRTAGPWPVPLMPTLARIRELAAWPLDFALCNLYPDGRASLGWHADDERDLAPGAPIASLSLGAERTFQVRFGREGGALFTVELAHGSLLVMGGATQRYYQHAVPPRLRCTRPRVNLTFRGMRAGGGHA